METGCCDRTRGSDLKLKEHRSTLDKRENFFMKLVKSYSRLPREVVDALSMEIIKATLDRAEQPDLVEDIPAHCRGVGLDDIERFLPTQTILQFYEDTFFKLGIGRAL